MASIVSSTEFPTPRPSQPGEPAWDVALLFPQQGDWDESAYLALRTKRLVELSNGCLEVLPMPTILHQLIAQFLFTALNEFVRQHAAGLVLIAPLRVRLWPGTIREPDVVYLRPGRATNRKEPPNGADLVIEVVSEGAENRERDLVTKRRQYAQAGITEYWIVDPDGRTITVLALDGQAYREHGIFKPGELATSVLLPGFELQVEVVFAAAEVEG